MTKASDNAFPSLLITEGTEPSAPAGGKQRVYIDSTSHHLMRTNSSGTETDIEAAAGGVATDAIWDAAGDLAVGTGANTAHKLVAGTSGYLLKSAGAADPTWAIAPTLHGVWAKKTSGFPTLTTAVLTTLAFDAADTYDTDSFHQISGANLTGTVTKTASSADLLGSSTLFTSELVVGQLIDVPGTATERRVVTVITDNTHLTCAAVFANNASGQTVARINTGLVVPSGMAGYYEPWALISYAANTTGSRQAGLLKNGALTLIEARGTITNGTSIDSQLVVSFPPISLAVWDYLELQGRQYSGGNLATTDQQFGMRLVGV